MAGQWVLAARSMWCYVHSFAAAQEFFVSTVTVKTVSEGDPTARQHSATYGTHTVTAAVSLWLNTDMFGAGRHDTHPHPCFCNSEAE